MKMNDICTQINPNYKTNSSVPVSYQINSLHVGEVCNSLSSGQSIANIQKIPTSSSVIQTSPLGNTNTLPFCNPKATSSTNYQTDPCVCDQLSSTPVLYNGSIVNKGFLTTSTTVGYYCSAK